MGKRWPTHTLARTHTHTPDPSIWFPWLAWILKNKLKNIFLNLRFAHHLESLSFMFPKCLLIYLSKEPLLFWWVFANSRMNTMPWNGMHLPAILKIDLDKSSIMDMHYFNFSNFFWPFHFAHSVPSVMLPSTHLMGRPEACWRCVFLFSRICHGSYSLSLVPRLFMLASKWLLFPKTITLKSRQWSYRKSEYSFNLRNMESTAYKQQTRRNT